MAQPIETEHCSDEASVWETLDSFPPPTLQYEPDEGLEETTWIFRGLNDASYPLEPTIEREAKGKSWPALESMIADEFRSKARMHLDPRDVPQDQMGWLALMQHYGVPTRLLDFTLSPYVALYFALRDRRRGESGAVAVWAVDAQFLRDQARLVSSSADDEEERYRAEKGGKAWKRPGRRPVSPDPRFFTTDLDDLQQDRQERKEIVEKALAPSKLRRDWFNKRGFVAYALPLVQNPRLSSQQGAFLFNAAEDLSFEESLFRMMGQGRRHACSDQWYRRIEVPGPVLPALEQRLFQMNIHSLSLFPDMEGLAGYIRQKARLHWFP